MVGIQTQTFHPKEVADRDARLLGKGCCINMNSWDVAWGPQKLFLAAWSPSFLPNQSLSLPSIFRTIALKCYFNNSTVFSPLFHAFFFLHKVLCKAFLFYEIFWKTLVYIDQYFTCSLFPSFLLSNIVVSLPCSSLGHSECKKDRTHTRPSSHSLHKGRKKCTALKYIIKEQHRLGRFMIKKFMIFITLEHLKFTCI